MIQNYSLHFFLKVPKNYSGGPKPIYIRLTVNGSIPKEASVGRKWNPENWISNANRAKGTTEAAKTLNSYLDAISRNVEMIHTNMVKDMTEVTAESLMCEFQSNRERGKVSGKVLYIQEY